MAQSEVLYGGLVLLLMLVGLGLWRFLAARRKEKLHTSFAQNLQLDLAYLSPGNFSMYGQYRGYAIKIKSWMLPPQQEKGGQSFTKISIPVTNPHRKILKVLKAAPDYAVLKNQVAISHPRRVQQEISPALEMFTNDMIFSSRVLSEEVKISIFEAFQGPRAGLMYIEDEELAMVLPEKLVEENAPAYWQKAMDLLADIKDELS